MTLMRIVCPECGAGLKSSAGFSVGEAVECPKCETNFSVEEPEVEAPAKAKKPGKAVARGRNRDDDDDDDDDRPRKKKKQRRDDDDERGYKNSPLRFIILGVLIIVMVVLGIMLIMKKQKEKEDAKDVIDAQANAGVIPPMGGQPPKVTIRPQPNQFNKQPNQFPNPNQFPKQNQFPNQPNQFQPPPLPPPSPSLLGGPPPGSPEARELIASLSKKLIGTWEGTGPDGTRHIVTYLEGGRFNHEIGTKATGGTWSVVGLIGSKGLKLNCGAGAPVQVIFDDDELIHDTGTPGEAVILKKK